MNQTILANHGHYFGSDHCYEHHHHEEHEKFPYLDVTKLFEEGVGATVKCNTSLAARINLFIKINGDSIPVFIQQYGVLLGVYYDRYEDGNVVRTMVPVKEVDDKLIKQYDSIELTLGSASGDDIVDNQLVQEMGSRISILEGQMITQNLLNETQQESLDNISEISADEIIQLFNS